MNSPSFLNHIEKKKIAASTILSKEEMHALLTAHRFLNDIEKESISLAIEHERINFPSYPYEWRSKCFGRQAYNLGLGRTSLKQWLGLKDATPYNILFKGTRPVFVDLLSFEKRNPHNPIWLPYSQFVKNFNPSPSSQQNSLKRL